jgi:hypothetical protein
MSATKKYYEVFKFGGKTKWIGLNTTGASAHCPRSAAFRPLQCPTVMIEAAAYALPNDEAA